MNAQTGQIILGVYAVLLAAGGVMGFVTKGSKPSLIAGLVSAVLAAAAAVLVGTSPTAGLLGGATLAALLLGFFGPRFAKSRKFMPAGLMTLVSVIVVASCLAVVFQSN